MGFRAWRLGGAAIQFDSNWPTFQRIASGAVTAYNAGYAVPVIDVPFSGGEDICAIRIPSGRSACRWYTDPSGNRTRFFWGGFTGDSVTYDIYRSARQLSILPGPGFKAWDPNGQHTFSTGRDVMIVADTIHNGDSKSFGYATSIALCGYSGYQTTEVGFEPSYKDDSTVPPRVVPDTWTISTTSIQRGVQNNNGVFSVVEMEVGSNFSQTTKDPGPIGGNTNDTPYQTSFVIKRYVD